MRMCGTGSGGRYHEEVRLGFPGKMEMKKGNRQLSGLGVPGRGQKEKDAV